MKTTRQIVAILVVGFLSLMAVRALPQQGQTSAQKEEIKELQSFLDKQEVKLAAGERALKATLFTIIPSSNRMVVKTNKGEDTFVLGISKKCMIKDGENNLSADDLKRGDVVVLHLEKGDNANVKGIYVYR